MANIFEKKKYYFKGFPKVQYNMDGESKEVLDFIHRWAFREHIKSNAAGWSKWIIRDQDTLFSMAKVLYGSEYYFWVIMMMNDMIDPFFDWPMKDKDLLTYTQKKYGIENVLSTHHYEADSDDNLYSLPPGTIVSIDYQIHIPSSTSRNLIQVNNYNYEAKLNEEKRKIKLLKPEFLDKVKREKEVILASSFGSTRI